MLLAGPPARPLGSGAPRAHWPRRGAPRSGRTQSLQGLLDTPREDCELLGITWNFKKFLVIRQKPIIIKNCLQITKRVSVITAKFLFITRNFLIITWKFIGISKDSYEFIPIPCNFFGITKNY